MALKLLVLDERQREVVVHNAVVGNLLHRLVAVCHHEAQHLVRLYAQRVAQDVAEERTLRGGIVGLFGCVLCLYLTLREQLIRIRLLHEALFKVGVMALPVVSAHLFHLAHDHVAAAEDVVEVEHEHIAVESAGYCQSDDDVEVGLCLVGVARVDHLCQAAALVYLVYERAKAQDVDNALAVEEGVDNACCVAFLADLEGEIAALILKAHGCLLLLFRHLPFAVDVYLSQGVADDRHLVLQAVKEHSLVCFCLLAVFPTLVEDEGYDEGTDENCYNYIGIHKWLSLR